MSEISNEEREVISGAFAAGGVGASLILTLSSPENEINIKDIDDFISYEVAI